MSEILTGRCLCGVIQYRCGPVLYAPTLCHCESCRRACGAHAVGWLTVSAINVAFTGDRPREYASSPGVMRSFCGRCGTPLTYCNVRRPDEVDITVCTLDQPEFAAPVDHIWMQDAPGWDVLCETLPRHSRGRQ
ncbi:MAG TPA: GFA family protein [Steroidobacteraceae bacterium]|jgi:hypothetical protein